MKIELLIAAGSAPCRKARTVWSAACAATGHPLRVVDVGAAGEADRMQALGLGVVPAVLIDGRLVAIGVQSAAEARGLLRRPPSAGAPEAWRG